MSSGQPLLPIVTPDPPGSTSRSQAEKFGGLFVLGIGGLVVLLALLAWFFWSMYSLRDVWTAVYVLNDRNRPDIERVNAAVELASHPNVNPRQLWDLSLNRVPPPLARYILAEALPASAIEADPSAYALAVARSEGWPDWLRLLLVRPMAYDDGRHGLPAVPLAELRAKPDPFLNLWAAYIQAIARDDREAATFLESSSRVDNVLQPLACNLRDALRAEDPGTRRAKLDEATVWLRRNHPAAASLWEGWEENGGRVVPGQTRPPSS